MAISHHDREEETLIAYFQQMLADVDDEEFSGEIQAASGDMFTPPPVAQEATSAAANQTVMESANAAISESFDTMEGEGPNPIGGLPHITTQDMLSQEISIVNDAEGGDNPISSMYDRPVVRHRSEVQPQVQPQPQPKPQYAAEREYAQPESNVSLKRLLASISPDVTHATRPAVETAVAEAKPAVQVAEATPQVQVAEAKPQVQVAEAAPQVQVAEVVPQVQVAEAAPQVQVAEAVPEVQVVDAAPQVQVVEAAPQVQVVEAAPQVATTSHIVTTRHEIKTPEQLAEERMNSKLHAINSEWKNVDLGQNFQALFFLAQGVRFAVPLIDLGGIFECDKITQLFGKPSWFMGITDVRGYKINIVDTLRWVMPEIGESPDKYPYLIALGTSQWAIGCDVLEGNRSLSADQVKWREIPGTRPWLAGIVSSNKCALLHVNALISLFNAGASIEDLVKDFEAEQKQHHHNK